MQRILLFLTIIFVALTSCEDFNDPESPYSEQYVIFGNISGNMPMIDDTIFVSRSASLDEKVDAFICSIGTGGTLSGLSAFLKEKKKNCF